MTKKFSCIFLLVIAALLSGCIGGEVVTELSFQDVLTIANDATQVRTASATFTIESTATDETEREFEVDVLEVVFDNVHNIKRFTKDGIEYLAVDIDLAIVHLNNIEELEESENLLGLVAHQVDKNKTLLAVWINDGFDDDVAMLPHVEPTGDPLNLSLTLVNDADHNLVATVKNGSVPSLQEGPVLDPLALDKGSALNMHFKDLFDNELSQDCLRTLVVITN
jgi:hypothetical protein